MKKYNLILQYMFNIKLKIYEYSSIEDISF